MREVSFYFRKVVIFVNSHRRSSSISGESLVISNYTRGANCPTVEQEDRPSVQKYRQHGERMQRGESVKDKEQGKRSSTRGNQSQNGRREQRANQRGVKKGFQLHKLCELRGAPKEWELGGLAGEIGVKREREESREFERELEEGCRCAVRPHHHRQGSGGRQLIQL